MRVVSCGLAAGLAMAAVDCRPVETEEPKQAVPVVQVVQCQRVDMTRSITLPGDLVGYYQAALYGKVTGYLKSIGVDKGDAITAGQVLAEIEVPELEQRLKRARANLQVQRRSYERLQRVWQADKRLVAREDVDVAEGQYEEAKARVEELEAMMSYTRIIAPFDGVVTGRFVDPGALIHGGDVGAGETISAARVPGSPVVSVADISKLRVYVYVPENETTLVRQGMPATLRLRELPGREFAATVTRFAKALDLSTRTMLTEIDLDNSKHELYPGMYAEVMLELVRRPGVLQLPLTAVGREAGKSFVYVATGGELARVGVTTGLIAAGQVEITSGLSGDESVVKHFSPALRAREKIQPVVATAEVYATDALSDGRPE